MTKTKRGPKAARRAKNPLANDAMFRHKWMAGKEIWVSEEDVMELIPESLVSHNSPFRKRIRWCVVRLSEDKFLIKPFYKD